MSDDALANGSQAVARTNQYVSTGEGLPSSALPVAARSSPRTATRRSQISWSILRKAASENS